MDSTPETPIDTLAREVSKHIPRQEPHGWELSLEEVSEVRTTLVVIKWLVGVISVSVVAMIILCVIMVTDHVHITDMAEASKDVRADTKTIREDVNRFGNKVDNLEHRIGYYNRTDHPTVTPNEE